MKKTFKLFVAALMLFTATSANAQFSRKENNRVPDRFHMGLRGGVTVSSFSESGLEPLTMPYGGIGLDFQIAPIPLFLGTGAYYMDRGYTYDKYTYGGYYEKDQHDRHSVVLPWTLSYHINVAPNFFINPFLGAVVSFDVEEDEEELVDYSLRIGTSLNFGRLYVDLGYDYGLKEWEKESSYYSTGKYYTSKVKYGTCGVFFMTLGFNWAGSR